MTEVDDDGADRHIKVHYPTWRSSLDVPGNLGVGRTTMEHGSPAH